MLADYDVFFDFDNTLTSFDVLDEVIQRFSINRSWQDFEEDWAAGRISSRDCLKGQLRSIRVCKHELSAYLEKIKVDEYFEKILILLKENGVSPAIVSDSFSFMIETILEHNGINGQYGLRIYSNRVRFRKDHLVPAFPYFSQSCSDCGNCKRNHVLGQRDKRKKLIYIGDGRSDICAAQCADLIFAKGTLLDFLRQHHKRCIPFDNLETVYHYLKEEKYVVARA